MTGKDALEQTTTLAKWAERLGYERFWVAEHHSNRSLASSSPEILVTHLASHTKRIRVGTGGVLLPHYSPFKVAEMFRVIEALYPNRTDLGLGRAPGGMPGVNYALHNGNYPNYSDYPKKVKELIAYLHGQDPHQYHVQATPLGKSSPPVWLLGSSHASAKLAGQLGIGYAYAQFINGEDGETALHEYQNYFRPSKTLQSPKSIIAVYVICGKTSEEADYLAASLDLALLQTEKGIQRGHFPEPEEAINYKYSYIEKEKVKLNRNRMIVGTPYQVKQKIYELADYYNVDEFMINTIISPFEKRLKSYELLINAFQTHKE
ncbi:LLM class flavin-dependent oxidoreductase [Salirhabdus salicampi]|nr:LLM class flavin-dependent oxidoreductase [Salirhabdus salicampi]